MPAVFVNMGTVLVGSLLGILFKNRLKESLQNALIKALALCTLVIGVSSAIGTQELLCVIICMALGTALGELLRIDDGIERAGDFIKDRLLRGRVTESRFTEGFVSACILFCVGSMTIMGSLEAGINHDYTIIYAKSTLDLVSSMAFGAAMGIGVTCSVVFILLFQGGLTLLAGLIAPALSAAVVTEMSAVGGTILIGMAINMLGLGRERIKVANMLPAIFLPIAYFPVSGWLSSVF
ncbi:MAG: DUF554 domain-containing protein [Oscillospiraceae bacterium]|nr:DUF554 domain-containing protein [Oscillospiraceae bacterium]